MIKWTKPFKELTFESPLPPEVVEDKLYSIIDTSGSKNNIFNPFNSKYSGYITTHAFEITNHYTRKGGREVTTQTVLGEFKPNEKGGTQITMVLDLPLVSSYLGHLILAFATVVVINVIAVAIKEHSLGQLVSDGFGGGIVYLIYVAYFIGIRYYVMHKFNQLFEVIPTTERTETTKVLVEPRQEKVPPKEDNKPKTNKPKRRGRYLMD